MTDRKVTCVACKSAITDGDIAHSDLEFGGELKATNQPEYTADADTDLVATIGTLDEYSPMVRTTGAQTISGVKTFKDYMIQDTNWPSYVMKGGATIDGSSHADRGNIVWQDNQGAPIGTLRFNINANGTTQIQLVVKNSNGTDKFVTLAEGDVI